MFGVLDLTLCYQRDEGDPWLHVPGRPDFVSHDDASWLGGMVFCGGNVERFGDEHRLYICGTNRSHGTNAFGGSHGFRIGYVAWPAWRLFGFHADPEGELEIELGELDRPHELRLNYECAGGGSIAVQLQTLARNQRVQDSETIAGYECEQANPLSGEALRAPVSWQGGAVIQPVPGKRLVARLFMQRAKVYAFELTPTEHA